MSGQLSFTVDTHIIRELGRLLVGRDSTALLELIKNAYDADATVVTVKADGLDAAGAGEIFVADNGNGMDLSRFKDGFLRIASRDKEANRLSPVYGRRLTGAKGVGRLASQKLAPTLIVQSVPRDRNGGTARKGVRAVIDWHAIEHDHEEITKVGDALRVEEFDVPPGMPHGTTLELKNIDDVWSSKRLGPFLDEIRSAQPPGILTAPIVEKIVDSTLIFDAPVVRECDSDDPGFSVDLTGQFTEGDQLWRTLSARFDWVIEISSQRAGISYSVSPTRRRFKSLKKDGREHFTQRYDFHTDHPDPSKGPFFCARIFSFDGSVGRKGSEIAQFTRVESGIRIYLEGFRVLPYGGEGNDWLGLDYDYTVRNRELSPGSVTEVIPDVENVGFYQLGNRSYVGAVFLTEEGAPHLQAVVNREGFVPDEYFQSLRDIVRTGVDLGVRARGALARRIQEAEDARKLREMAERRRQAEEELKSHIGVDESTEAVVEAEDRQLTDIPGTSLSDSSDVDAGDDSGDADAGFQYRASDMLTAMRTAIAAMRRDPLDLDLIEVGLRQIDASISLLTEEISSVASEQLIMRTLATVGTQYSAFVHEINGLLAQAQTLRRLVDQIDVTPKDRSVLRTLRSGVDELVQALTRQTSYLTDVVGPDARRRRRRLPLRQRAESSLRILATRIANRNIDVTVDVGEDLHTPPIFPAELAIIFTNLLSNATKFAGRGGKIRISAGLDESMTLWITVENTGAKVPKKDWERYFRPFESSTTDVDVILGQGMGLGLPIVRNVANDYEGLAEFTPPSRGFATAVTVALPDPRPRLARRQVG